MMRRSHPLVARLCVLVLLLSALVSCKPRIFSDSHLQGEDIPGRTEVDEFRALFAHAIGPQLNDGDLKRLIYYPVPNMFSAAAAPESDFFSRLARDYRDLTPDELFNAATRFVPRGATEPAWSALKQHPVTFVLIPGVFGEFLKTRAMEEVLKNTQSTSAKSFAAALVKSGDKLARTDHHFDLDAFANLEKPLGELLDVASLDDAEGSPVLELVSFATPSLSLESLGRNADVAPVYLRRLAKYFALVGLPKNIVFLGYSRGAAVALDMMSAAQNEPWFRNVRGFVSLGGVLYGSDLADEIYRDGSSLFRLLKALEELESSLRTLDGTKLSERPAIVAANTGAWGRFAKEVVTIDPEFAKSTLINAKDMQLGASFAVLKELWQKFNLDAFFTAYSDNIRRFKRAAAAIREAAEELTTKKRLEWWQNHTIPVTGLTYYSLVATMADPATATMGPDNAASEVSYGPDSPDKRTLISGYRDFVTSTGFRLNDSQVAVHKAMLWPSAHKTLNPRQEAIPGSFLGVLATHHWAIALPVVQESRPPVLNPYPREALLKALAAKVAWDLERR